MPMTPVLLTAAALIDGTGAPPRVVDILIEDGRIAAIGEEIEAPETARVLDLEGSWVAPGLVDAHVHVGTTPGSTYRSDTPEQADEIHLHQLRAFVAAGITTALDCASSQSQ